MRSPFAALAALLLLTLLSLGAPGVQGRRGGAGIKSTISPSRATVSLSYMGGETAAERFARLQQEAAARTVQVATGDNPTACCNQLRKAGTQASKCAKHKECVKMASWSGCRGGWRGFDESLCA